MMLQGAIRVVLPVALARSMQLVPGLLSLVLACGPGPSGVDGPHASSSTSGDTTTTASTTTITTTTSNGASTSTSALDGTTDATEGGIVFLIERDGGSVAFECDTYAQDCPRGHKCMPYARDGGSSYDATRCVPVVGDPHAAGEPCTVVGSPLSGEDDCDATSMCLGADPETLQGGVCASFCAGDDADPICPDSCQICPVNQVVYFFCLDRCDPLVPDCPPGWACHRVWNPFEFACIPTTAGPDAGIGSECQSSWGCPPGLACLSGELVPGCDGLQACCTPYCPPGAEDPCPALVPGTVCTERFEDNDPPEGCPGASVGACALP